ncbi:MAG: cyclopropane-fatty-acyl-phospholipid synthase family protein [Candidatus Saccharimonadales bacterium]|jgi:cyclopropane-fatty-acyl-phospholipid synthase
MFEKKILSKALSTMQRGGIAITYWDGDTQNYGPDKPYATVTIKDPSVVRRMVRSTSLGFGECYAEGLIEVDGPLTSIVRLTAENPIAIHNFISGLGKVRLKKNRTASQKSYIAHHYDIGNDFYKLWLDETMLYTCAYFRTPKDTLEMAQKQKIQHVLKKLRLEKGMSLADLGCGWGDLLITAAKQYGVRGIGVTLSEEQVKHANARAKAEKLDHLISFKLMNFQDLPKHTKGKQFDRVVSVGMMEHVGKGNMDTYFTAVDALLKPGSISLMHYITSHTEVDNDPWIDKYIFPGGYLQSIRQSIDMLPKYNFYLTDYESLRLHYAMTCREWRRRFNAHKPEVVKMFDEQFYRMWDFWLASSEASFQYGVIDLSHFVFTKGIVNDLPLTREDWY